MTLLVLGAILPIVLSSCCTSHEAEFRVDQPVVVAVPRSRELRAGVAEIDITPPPGFPLFGYSVEGRTSRGYWTRLFARAFVFESPAGERLAVVQLDLGASSTLVQRSAAAKLAGVGIAPSDLVLLATHTHAAPGGYFGSCFYNTFGANQRGFDRRFTEWLSSRIAAAVADAFGRLEPARIAIGSTEVTRVSRNRSPEAWRRNFLGAPPYDGVLPKLTVIRVDSANGTPLGALIFFPIHGTSVGSRNVLYHGDLQGVAERLLAARLERRYHAAKVVAAFADGPEGDVSPDWKPHQGESESLRIGAAIAEAALTLVQQLDGRSAPLPVTHAFAEVTLPRAAISTDRVCESAVIGVATVGGAADGRSWLYRFGFSKGHGGAPRGCQREKRAAFGFLQRVLLHRTAFPATVPLHMIAFGDRLTIVTVPGEPTTEVGRRIAKHVMSTAQTADVVVAAHGDDYVGYVTTAEEYGEQDYEGSSTLYGPREAAFFEEQLTLLAKSKESSAAADAVFHPGRPRDFLGAGSCDAASWQALHTTPHRGSNGRLDLVTFVWSGLAAGHSCETLPTVSVECDGRPLVNEEGRLEDDTWTDFHVSRDGHSDWTAQWRVHAASAGARCHIEVARPALPPIVSNEFSP